jgi:hypothetical protein
MGTSKVLDRYYCRFVAGQPALIPERKATFDYYAIARVEGARAFLKAARPLATRVLAVVVLIIDCGSYKHLPDSGTKYDEVSK